MLGHVVGPGIIAVSKRNKNPCLPEAWSGETDNKQIFLSW